MTHTVQTIDAAMDVICLAQPATTPQPTRPQDGERTIPPWMRWMRA